MELHELKTLFEQHHAKVVDLDSKLADAQDRLNVIEINDARAVALNYTGGGKQVSEVTAGFTKFLRSGTIETRSMGESSDPSGGYFVPSELSAQIADQLIEVSPVRGVCRVDRISTADYGIPVNRRGASSGWAGTETTTRLVTDTPLIAMVKPPVHELWATAMASQWVIDDSAYNIADFVLRNIVDEFAFQEGVAFISADGVGKPKGFLTQPVSADGDATRPFATLQYVNSGAANGLTPDGLVDLAYLLKPAYRQGEKVAWMMNSTTASVIRKMKSGDGSWLWQPSMTAGQPAQLLGFDVVEAESMPAATAGNFPVAFGNWRRGFVIVDRTNDRIIRDDVTVKGSVIFYISRRLGGNVLDSNAIKLLKVAA